MLDHIGLDDKQKFFMDDLASRVYSVGSSTLGEITKKHMKHRNEKTFRSVTDIESGNLKDFMFYLSKFNLLKGGELSKVTRPLMAKQVGTFCFASSFSQYITPHIYTTSPFENLNMALSY